MQDCLGEEQNDRIEMKEKGKLSGCESTGESDEGERREKK